METASQPSAADKLDEWLGIDIRNYLRVLRRRWPGVALITVAIVGLTFVWTYRQPKTYEASTTIVINPMAPQILQNVKDVVELGTGSYWANREFYETQYRLIRSREVAQLVVDRLGLVSDSSYPTPEISEEKKKELDHSQLVIKQTKVVPIKDSRIATIAVLDRYPDRAARIANALAQAYIDRNLEQKIEGSHEAAVWLGDQVVALRDRLRQSELAVYEFRKQKQLLDISLDNKQSMTNKNLETFNTKLAEVRTKRIEFEAERNLILKARDSIEAQETLPLIRENIIIQQLRSNYIDLKKKLVEMEARYLEKNPKMQALHGQLDSIQRDYRAEIDKILKTFENRYSALIEQEKALARTMAQEKKEAIELSKLEVEYRPLTREVEETQRVYDLVTTREKETSLTGLIRNNNVRVLDRAKPDDIPVRPRLLLNLAIALVLGLGCGVGIAFVIELLDNTIKSQEHAEAILGVPVLGMVPIIGDKPNKKLDTAKTQERDLGVLRDPQSSAAEACRSIRTNLMFLSPEKALKTLVVTSPGPQEGKTTTAINLAITMAQAGAKVLLVDTDLRRPRIHKSFNVPNDAGIANLIVENKVLGDVVRHTDVPGLHILTSGPHPPNPAELLHTKRFAELITEFSQQYDRVIFDSPPTSAVTDPAVIGHLTDGVILVFRVGYTTRYAASFAKRQITDAKARILGTIVNRVDLTDKTYNYHYYRYYRSYRYGGYYDKGEKAGA